MYPIAEDKTQRIRIRGRVRDIPMVLPFHGGNVKYGYHVVVVVDFRPPLAGEFYLSGAQTEVFKALSNLGTPYLVVRKGPEVVAKRFWVPKEQG